MTMPHSLSWTKGVSRSFYLSLRLLPGAMREAAAVGYLIARISDTLTDSVGLPAVRRLSLLRQWAGAVGGDDPTPEWPRELTDSVPDERERRLLGRSGEVLAMLRSLPAPQAALVREVAATISSGQELDLTRFPAASAAVPVALSDDDALADYAWRVAGCVGEFWTKLGFLTMAQGFATEPAEVLLPPARRYGMGLQLVNILRDLPGDLAAGRCYLPVADPHDWTELLACHARWLAQAREWVAEGRRYAAAMKSRRVRAASLLPALLAEETLDALANASRETLRARVKVPRRRVYALLWRAFVG
jgi:farnesyl-diphosphate farnesyltransferase